MPGGDGTGPMGMGPMTGRGAGYCAGYSAPGYANPIGGGRGFLPAGRQGYGRGAFGRGFYGRGFGRGGGRGRRNWYYATGLPGWSRANMGMSAWGSTWANPYYAQELTSQQELDMLNNEAKALQDEIKSINGRIAELETESKKK